jgi:hypothetical protein
MNLVVMSSTLNDTKTGVVNYGCSLCHVKNTILKGWNILDMNTINWVCFATLDWYVNLLTKFTENWTLSKMTCCLTPVSNLLNNFSICFEISATKFTLNYSKYHYRFTLNRNFKAFTSSEPLKKNEVFLRIIYYLFSFYQ